MIDTLFSHAAPSETRIDRGKGGVPMQHAFFYHCFASDVFAVKPAIIEALQYIQDALPGISGRDIYELRLIFSELLFNAVIHGNKSNRDKNVRFHIDIQDITVRATVQDEGEGYDYIRWLNSLDEPDRLYNEHGRGIKLVKALTDSIEFNPIGNAILFCKKVSLNG